MKGVEAEWNEQTCTITASECRRAESQKCSLPSNSNSLRCSSANRCRLALFLSKDSPLRSSIKQIYAPIARFRSRLPVVFPFLFNFSLRVLNLISLLISCRAVLLLNKQHRSPSLSLAELPTHSVAIDFRWCFCCTFVFNFSFFLLTTLSPLFVLFH